MAAGTAQAVARARGRLRSLDKRLTDQLNRHAEGRTLRPEFRAATDALVRERRLADDDLHSQQQRASAQASEVERRKHFERQVELMRNNWEQLSFDSRQSTLRELVEKIVVRDDGITTVLRG